MRECVVGGGWAIMNGWIDGRVWLNKNRKASLVLFLALFVSLWFSLVSTLWSFDT